MDITADTPRAMGDHAAPHVSPVTPAEDMRTVLINNVSWGAVFAGSVVAIVLQAILNILGVAVGAATVDTTAATTDTVRSVPMLAAVWWTVSGIISAYVGAFTAGRLCGRPKETTGGWHGLTSWALTMLLVFAFLGSAMGVLIGGSFTTLADGMSGPYGTSDRATASRTTSQTMSADADTSSTQSTSLSTSAATPDTSITDTSTTPEATSARSAAAPSDTSTSTGQGPVAATATSLNRAMAGDPEEIKRATSRAALFSFIALVIGAVAAWFGGRAGVVDPTITAETEIATNKARYQRAL